MLNVFVLISVIFSFEVQAFIPGIPIRPPEVVLDKTLNYTFDLTINAEKITITKDARISIQNGATLTLIADEIAVESPMFNSPAFINGTGAEGKPGTPGVSESPDQLYSYYDDCSQTCNIAHGPLPTSELALKKGENGGHGSHGGKGATIIFKYKKMTGAKIVTTTRGGEGGRGGTKGSGRLICCTHCGACKVIPPGNPGKKGSTGPSGKEIRIPIAAK